MSGSAADCRTLLLVHHSHTDIGYTERQAVITSRHAEFIDRALAAATLRHAIARATDYGAGLRLPGD
jgi:hypothetical protein